MVRHQYYKPAIQEAIFEAKFPNNDFDIAIPGQIYERIKESYPEKKDFRTVQFIIGKHEVSDIKHPQAPIMQAWKKDNSSLVQIGPGIITANHLKYSNWENFSSSIQEILGAYIGLAKPQFISRVAVRYINRFIIQGNTVTLGDYFNLGFQIPDIFQNLEGFDLSLLHKKKLADIDFQVKTKFMTDILKAEEIGNSFILDIDCHYDSHLEPKLTDIQRIAKYAHDVIEEIFENMITEKTRNLMGIQK